MEKVMRGIAIILMIVGAGIVLASVESVPGTPVWMFLSTAIFGMALCYASYNMFILFGGDEFFKFDSPFEKSDWRW